MKRIVQILAAATIVAGVGFSGGGHAIAGVDWCSSDPPVHLILPSGQPLELTVTVSVPAEERAALQAVVTSGQVLSVEDNVAQVEVDVTVPDDEALQFPVAVSSASLGQPGDGTVTGIAGKTVSIPLTIVLPPVPARSPGRADDARRAE